MRCPLLPGQRGRLGEEVVMRYAYLWRMLAPVNEADHNRRLAREVAELKLKGKPVNPKRVFRGGPKGGK